MKNWWLNLYTYPALILLARSTCLVLVAIFLINFFFPGLIHLAPILSLYITYSQYMNCKKGICANVDFHKIHIPFPQLKTSVLKDSFIQMTSTFISVCICCYYAWINVNKEKLESELFFIVPLAISVFFIFMMTSLNPVVNGRYKYKLIDLEKFNKFIFYPVTFLVLWLGSILVTIGAFFFGFDPFSYGIVLGLGFGYGAKKFVYQAVFHQAKSITTYKQYWKNIGMDWVRGGAFLVAMMVLSYPLVKIPDVHPDIKMAALRISDPLPLYIDNNMALELIKANRDDVVNLGIIISHADDINQIPITEVFDRPSINEYVVYLHDVKDPTAENLKMIMSNNIEKTDKNKQWFSSMNKLIVKKWPKEQKFPKHLLAEEVVLSDRVPASTKKQN